MLIIVYKLLFKEDLSKSGLVMDYPRRLLTNVIVSNSEVNTFHIVMAM